MTDSTFYAKMWAERLHVCEECDRFLGDKMSRIFISHILSKGAWNYYRHDPRNINILCPFHHQQWEFKGDRNSMKIYKKNLETMNKLKLEYYDR